MFPGVLGSGVLQRTPAFGERLDLKRRRGSAADLSSKELQILLDPAQETAQIRLVLHVGCVARREGRAVITEAEDALPLMQERMGQGDAERVEIAGLYWHFVDVVWIVIFTVVYLVPN